MEDWKRLERGVFLVNCLAVFYDNEKILIGKRLNDPYISELSWSFPGGRPTYGRSLEESLRDEVAKKTGMNIRVMGLYHARLFEQKPEFLLLYYLAKLANGNLEAGEKFVDVKWVLPFEVQNYFTTPIDDTIKALLRDLSENPDKVFSTDSYKTSKR